MIDVIMEVCISGGLKVRVSQNTPKVSWVLYRVPLPGPLVTLSLQPMHTTMLWSFAALDRASVSAEGTAMLLFIILHSRACARAAVLAGMV